MIIYKKKLTINIIISGH